MNQTLAGALATFVGAAVWGLIWFPVYHIESMGLTGLWSIVFIQPAAVVAAFVALVYVRELAELRKFDNWLVGASMGLSTMLYFSGILLSDVVRVIFLFYTLPVWAILWNAVFFRIKPTATQYVVIVIALVGLWLFLTGGEAIAPLPSNLGDWCGLTAGAMWGLGLTLLENKPGTSAKATSFTAFLFAFSFAAIVCIFFAEPKFSALPTEVLAAAIPMAVAVGLLLQFPTMLLVIWGGQRLSAPTASLITMSELLAATVSASLILGNSLNIVSWIGGGIIVLAAIVDIMGQQRSAAGVAS